MTRLSLAVLSALALAGCVVVPVAPSDGPPPPPPPPPRVVVDVPPPEPSPVVWYHGPHFVPEDEGGGWCYEEGAHTHSYFPDDPHVYVVDRGYYTYDGPTVFVYVGGHPLPGGGWCFLAGPHHHDYFPPPRAGFVWHRGHGYYYEGAYRANRPPPATFWPRPVRWHRAPPPSRLPTVPAPVYRPPRTAPQPPPRTVPVPPARAPDRFDDRDRDRKDDRGRFDDDNRDRKDGRERFSDRDRKDDHERATPATPATPATLPPPPAPPRDDRGLERGRHGDAPKGGPAAAPGQQERVQPVPPRGKPGVTEAGDRGRNDDGKDRKSAERKDKTDKKDDKDDARPPASRPVRPAR